MRCSRYIMGQRREPLVCVSAQSVPVEQPFPVRLRVQSRVDAPLRRLHLCAPVAVPMPPPDSEGVPVVLQVLVHNPLSRAWLHNGRSCSVAAMFWDFLVVHGSDAFLLCFKCLRWRWRCPMACISTAPGLVADPCIRRYIAGTTWLAGYDMPRFQEVRRSVTCVRPGPREG